MKNDHFPSAPQAVWLLLALFMLEVLLGALLYDLQDLLGSSDDERGVYVRLLGHGVLFTVLLQRTGRSYRSVFHDSPHSMGAAAILLVPIALILPAILLLDSVVSGVLVALVPLSGWEEQAFERMAQRNLPTFVAVCVLAPVLEEMLFRGVILRAFLHRYPPTLAIWQSALFFGFAHLNLYQFVLAFLLGGLAGWIYERSRSLIPCIALHAFFNTAVTLLSWTQGAEPDQALGQGGVMTWILALALGSVGVTWLFLSLRKKAAPSMPVA
ncbi:MAG: CPBP family intramembrane glutamic endopeptidase [Pseudomonadota bacterium]